MSQDIGKTDKDRPNIIEETVILYASTTGQHYAPITTDNNFIGNMNV